MWLMMILRDGNENIFFRSSSDLGVTWSAEEQLTHGVELESIDPSLAISYCGQVKTIHLAWSQQYGQWERRITYSHKEIPTGIDDNSTILPMKKEMLFCYPNPFNSTLKMTISAGSPGVLNIYDLLGRVVKTFAYRAGVSSVIWDGIDNNGAGLPSGIYFAKLTANEAKAIKLIYLK